MFENKRTLVKYTAIREGKSHGRANSKMVIINYWLIKIIYSLIIRKKNVCFDYT